MPSAHVVLFADIARICHEANRAYCLTIGDPSQVAWDDAPDWQKASAIQGVQNISEGVVRMPADSHRSWLDHKLAEGWVYGPVKDPEKKEHPCMVPFEKLPMQQRRKDHLFFAIARTMLDA